MLQINLLFTVPGKPREVEAMLDDGNIYVFWEEPSNPNGIILKYQVRRSLIQFSSGNVAPILVVQVVFSWYSPHREIICWLG